MPRTSSFSRADIEEVLAFAEDELNYYKSHPRDNVNNARAFGVYVEAMKFQLEKEKVTMPTEGIIRREPVSEPKDESGWYCVIGPNVTQNHPIKRSWKTDQEEAARHAEKLINDSFDGHRSKTKRLLVVKVVEVIEVAGPPISRRTGSAISKDDVAGSSSEDD